MAKSSQPLSGRRIAVTRAREQASELTGKLVALGAEVVELPLIHVSKEIDKQTLADCLLELGGYDWAVFTSPNGVRFFFDEFFRLFDDIRSLGLLRIACIGESTAAAVSALHLKVECQPKVASAEALAEELIATGSLDSARVLVITGSLNRDTLVKKLDEARAIVDELQVYKTEQVDVTGLPVTAEFRAKGADAILFASSSAVFSYASQLASIQPLAGAQRPLMGAIGPQTSDALKQSGFAVDFAAKTPGLDALVDALLKRLSNNR